jgi:regulator of sigma E protease
MDTIMTIIYFILAIGILVIAHEFGHFILARLSGMRTEVFAFGMGYRLFGWNKVNGFSFGSLPKDFDGQGHTDYRVAAFPIGGYVKISGMVDESMDTDYKETQPQPWEFRSKNAFLKAITISGGVIMNVLLAFLIFLIIIQINGKEIWNTTTVGSVTPESIAGDIGFLPGDKILKINDKKIEDWEDFGMALSLDDMGDERNILLERNDRKTLLKADGNKIIKDMADKKPLGIYPEYFRTYVTSVQGSNPAGKLGLQPGDTMIAINETKIASVNQFAEMIKKNQKQTVLLTWKRGDKTYSDSITPTSEGVIGVGISQIYTGKKYHEKYGLISSAELAANETYKTLEIIIGSFAQMISGNVSFTKSVGGPIAIAQMASQEAERGILSFFNFVALLSLMLAIVNILPFPALDGGHLVFIIIEALIRREIPLKFKLAIQQVGMFILLLFMVFVIYLDIIR